MKMESTLFVVLLMLMISVTSSARILALTAFPESHGRLLTHMAQLLVSSSISSHKHQVEFISFQDHVGLYEQHGFLNHLVKPGLNLTLLAEPDNEDQYATLPTLASWCQHLLINEELFERLRDRNFTLLLLDLFGNDVCPLVLARKLGVPVIGIWPWSASYPVSSLMGLSSHSDDDESEFFSRNLVDCFFSYFQKNAWHDYYSTVEGFVSKLNGGNYISKFDLYNDHVTILLANQNAVLESARPLLPNIIPVGGFNCHLPQALPNEVEKFARSFRSGVIFVSFARSELLGVFTSFQSYGFIWNSDALGGESNDTISNVIAWPKNSSYNDILGHPRTRLVISSCDTNDVMTAVFHGVPLICVPFNRRQKKLSTRLVQLEIAIEIDSKFNLTSDSIARSARKILKDERFIQRCRRVSLMFRDEPESPADRLTYWIDYVARYKGIPDFLSSPRVKQPSCMTYFMDFIGCLTVLMLICAVVGAVAYALYRIWCSKVQAMEAKNKTE